MHIGRLQGTSIKLKSEASFIVCRNVSTQVEEQASLLLKPHVSSVRRRVPAEGCSARFLLYYTSTLVSACVPQYNRPLQ